MSSQTLKTYFSKQGLRLYRMIRLIGLVRMLLVLLFPVLTGLLMKRNDYSLKEDLHRLFIFTACTAVWLYLFVQKRSRHA